MYKYIITKEFTQNQGEYLNKINNTDLKKYLKVKKDFIENPFDKKLNTHKILEKCNFIVYSSYIRAV